MRYKTQADAGSLSNTPPAYGIYICGLVFKWLKEMGGLEVMAQRNLRQGPVALRFPRPVDAVHRDGAQGESIPHERPVHHRDADLDAKFIAEAKGAGLSPSRHRSVGGMPEYHKCDAEGGRRSLVAFMDKFERETRKTSCAGFAAALRSRLTRLS